MSIPKACSKLKKQFSEQQKTFFVFITVWAFTLLVQKQSWLKQLVIACVVAAFYTVLPERSNATDILNKPVKTITFINL